MDDGIYFILDDVYVILIKLSWMSVFLKVYDYWFNYEFDIFGLVNVGGFFKGFVYKVVGSMLVEF